MTPVGTTENPLRVAIIGSGPAGFYTADHLLKRDDLTVEIDIFDKLPTPFGLVRAGVAPDHQKIKNVAKLFDRIARRDNVRFYGNVRFGSDVTIDDLRQYYHQIVYATGAQTDRNLNIPGEDLKGSHAATEFVAWYNGHPEYQSYEFDLSVERAAVIGVGNVAVDVCRILCRDPDRLAETDIADYALDALRKSNIKEVHMIGRRGPAQGAFTNPELKELGELEGAEAYVYPDEAELDELSKQWLEENDDRTVRRKVEIIQEFARKQPDPDDRKLIIRFLRSPVEFIGDEAGRVKALRLVRNELYFTDAGSLRPRHTDDYETLECGLVFRSIGYRGVPLRGVPFNDRWGVILNEKGRVIDPDRQGPRRGEYCTGWIKRGATGVIGTNKADAAETVECMLEDFDNGAVLDPDYPDPMAAQQLIRDRKPNFVSYEDWLRLDEIERERGKEAGRPRVKFTTVEEMLAVIERQRERV